MNMSRNAQLRVTVVYPPMPRPCFGDFTAAPPTVYGFHAGATSLETITGVQSHSDRHIAAIESSQTSR